MTRVALAPSLEQIKIPSRNKGASLALYESQASYYITITTTLPDFELKKRNRHLLSCPFLVLYRRGAGHVLVTLLCKAERWVRGSSYVVVLARALVVSLFLLFTVLPSSCPIGVPIAELRIFQASLRNSSACGIPLDAIETPAMCYLHAHMLELGFVTSN